MTWTQNAAAVAGPARVVELTEFLSGIERFQRERPDMHAVRDFNHQMVDALHRLRPLGGRALIDVGASWTGYSLEHALARGARLFAGVSLEIREPVEVRGPGGVGRLLPMNAEALEFPDGSFDLLLSLSTFEHFLDGARVLREMHRVLVPGGTAFVSFEPVWTCSYGHHLHHLGDAARLIPPWAHLIWDAERMRAALAPAWPASAAMALDDAVRMAYESDQLNRLPLAEVRRLFEESPFTIEWSVPLKDDKADAKPLIAEYLARVLPWDAETLMTRGLSLLLNKT